MNAPRNTEVYEIRRANLMERLFHGSIWQAMVDGDDGYEPRASTDLVGWWWWSCSPGCLPDSEPFGPFGTEDEAIRDAWGDEEPGDEEPEEP